jgi:hypothetical protein
MSGLLIASYVVLWLLVLLLLSLVLLLYRQYGRSMMESRERIEFSGLALGEKVPALSLQVDEGQAVAVDWLGSTKGTAVLFALPGCPICGELMNEQSVAELARQWQDVDFMWVDGESRPLDAAGRLDGWRFLYSPDRSAHHAAEVPASPYAYMISNRARVLGRGLINNRDQLSGMLSTAFGASAGEATSADENREATRQGTGHAVK